MVFGGLKESFCTVWNCVHVRPSVRSKIPRGTKRRHVRPLKYCCCVGAATRELS
jgi:hypothetical protein